MAGRRRVGTKRVTGTKTPERPIAFSIRLSPRELDALRALAGRAGTTVTEVVRSAIVAPRHQMALGNTSCSTSSTHATLVVNEESSEHGRWQATVANRTEA